MADPMMDENVAGAEGAEQPGGYEICIKVAPDGSMSVGVDMEGEESAPPAPGIPPAAPEMDDDASYQPVSSIKEAIQVVMDIYQNAGQMTNMAADNAEFDKGFGKPAGMPPKPPMGGMQ